MTFSLTSLSQNRTLSVLPAAKLKGTNVYFYALVPFTILDSLLFFVQ